MAPSFRIFNLRYRENGKDYLWPPHRVSTWQWYAVAYGQVRMETPDGAVVLTRASAILIPPRRLRSPACQGKPPGCVIANFRPPFPVASMAGRPLPIPPGALRAFHALVQELKAPAGASQKIMAQALFTQVFLSQWKAFRSRVPSPRPAPALANLPRAESISQRIDDFLARHFREEISRGAIARGVGLSPSQCARLFKTSHNQTLHRRLVALRLEEARALLLGSSHSISQIAQEVGFASSSHFSQLLKRHCGVTPTAYRQGGGHLYGAAK